MITLNAFHPLFVKTHMPQFLTALKTDDRQLQAGTTLSKHVTEKRKTVPSHGSMTGISKVQRESVPNQAFQDISAFPKTRKMAKGWERKKGREMTMEQVREELDAKKLTTAQKAMLAPREFHTFSKAGTANTTKVKKK
jgi:hypothetical protein